MGESSANKAGAENQARAGEGRSGRDAGSFDSLAHHVSLRAQHGGLFGGDFGRRPDAAFSENSARCS